MKTIKIFLASSSELEDDRKALVMSLFEKSEIWQSERGVKLVPLYWENFGNAVQEKGSQEYYHEQVQECDQFLTICWRKAGELTVGEYDVAYDNFLKNKKLPFGLKKEKPIIRTYFKQLAKDDVEEKSLGEFKSRLEKEKHYRANYLNTADLCKQYINELEKDYLIRSYRYSIGIGLIGLALILCLGYFYFRHRPEDQLDLAGQRKLWLWLGLFGLATGAVTYGAANLFEKYDKRFIRGKYGLSITTAVIVIISGGFFFIPPVTVYRISGIVTNALNKAVPQVEINVEGTTMLTFSDSQGNFQLKFDRSSQDSTFTIVTSHEKYQDFSKSVRLASPEIRQDIILNPVQP